MLVPNMSDVVTGMVAHFSNAASSYLLSVCYDVSSKRFYTTMLADVMTGLTVLVSSLLFINF